MGDGDQELTLSTIGFKASASQETLGEMENHYLGVLTDVAANFSATDESGSGGQLVCYKSDKYPELVLKRLKTVGERYRQNGASIEEYFRALEEEHYRVLGFYGYKFVPDTEFIISDSIASLPKDPSKFDDKKDFVMIQERAYGEDSMILRYFDREVEELIANVPSDIAPLLIANAREFLTCYQHMLWETGQAIEEQFFIDPDRGTIKIYDTNHLKAIDKDPHEMLRHIGIDPSAVHNGRDIINVLSNKYPELKDIFSPLLKLGYDHVVRACDPRSPGNERESILDSLKKYGDDAVFYCSQLLFSMMHFSPPGEPNDFILRFQNFIDKLEVNLRTTQNTPTPLDH